MWCRRVTQIRAVTALLSTFVAVQAVGQAASGTLRGRVSDTRGHTVGGAQLLLYIGNRAEVRATAVSDHLDRKSTRLNSSHANISYAVFCLKKKNKKKNVLSAGKQSRHNCS